MYPDREILRTNRWSYGLSKRPNDHNNLNLQFNDTNDAPRDPLHVPVTWNPARTQPYSTLRLRLCLRIRLQSSASLTPSRSP